MTADLDVLVDALEGAAADVVSGAYPMSVEEALTRAVEGALDNDAHRTILWLLVAQKLT